MAIASHRKYWYNDGMKTKQKTSITLTEQAKQLLVKLAEHYGVSQSAMLELIIREKAKRDEIK